MKGIWIEHQNRQCVGIYTTVSVSGNGVIGYQGPEDAEGAILGSYGSTGKAIMVVQNIIGVIKSNMEHDRMDIVNGKTVRKLGSSVFTMPEV